MSVLQILLDEHAMEHHNEFAGNKLKSPIYQYNLFDTRKEGRDKTEQNKKVFQVIKKMI